MSLVVENLSYEYMQGESVLSNYSLKIDEGEQVVLVGPSGCGKSTLLHCVAGLCEPKSGTIYIDGEEVSQKKPYERGIGIMMQDQPLYEHLTVEKNIAFPLRARGDKKTDVSKFIDVLQLADVAKQKVSKCSGGERRRVAFARAVVLKPRLLLLDEPFVSLNDELREIIMERIQDIGTTTLLVTHNLDSTLTTSKTIKKITLGSKTQG
jgi:ABC-type sugar transport system ATPase subunit|tara:strand:+ start:644 stop:1267 length:624 start_codon:yes stop_codon:yes gene_type:complete